MSCELDYEDYEPNCEDIELWQQQELEQAVALVDEVAVAYGWRVPGELIERLGVEVTEKQDVDYEPDFEYEPEIEDVRCAGVSVTMRSSARERVQFRLALAARQTRRSTTLVPLVRRDLPQPRPRQSVRRRRRATATRAGPARSPDDGPLEAELVVARFGGCLGVVRERAA